MPSRTFLAERKPRASLAVCERTKRIQVRVEAIRAVPPPHSANLNAPSGRRAR